MRNRQALSSFFPLRYARPVWATGAVLTAGYFALEAVGQPCISRAKRRRDGTGRARHRQPLAAMLHRGVTWMVET